MKIIRRMIQFFRGVLGKIIEYRVNLTKKPIIFRDVTGFFFLLRPGDAITAYYRRNSVSDAVNIQKYLPQCKLEDGSRCIDIGSHFGAVSMPIWSHVGKSGKVISVDADPRNVERIRINLMINGFLSDYVRHYAISDKKDVLRLRCYDGINGWQTLGNPSFAASHRNYTIEVPSLTFADLIREFDLEYIDLVKIDVEGAELMVLQGMADSLKGKKIGCVIFEVNHLMLEGFGKTVKDLFYFWENYEYNLFRLLSNGSLEDIGDSWPETETGDCVALPF